MEISDEIIRLLFLIYACDGGYRFLTWCYSKVEYQTRPHFREAHPDP